MLGACSSDPGTGTGSDDVTSEAVAVCAKQSVNGGVTHCTTTFADAPFVRGPAASIPASGDVKLRAAVQVANVMDFAMMAVASDGTRLAIVDDHGALAAFDKPPSVLKALGFPSYRTVSTLYDLEGTIGDEVDSPWGKLRGLRVTKAAPAVVIEGCALASVLVGTWEGTVTTRLATPIGSGPLTKTFDESKTAPLHVTVSATAAFGKFIDWNSRATDLDNFQLRAVIDNLTKEFRDGDTVYPALSSLQGGGPFAGATDGSVNLYRLGTMHGIGGDGHWVLDYPKGSQDLTTNGMSQEAAGIFAAGASWLTQKTPDADLGEVVIRPHLPYSRNGHVVRLHPLKIGAQAGHCG